MTFNKFKRTARTLRKLTHVVFTPPQLSRPPNQIAVIRCFFAQGVAVAVSTQVDLLQDVILESYATILNFALLR
jgi:hypothetical protein